MNEKDNENDECNEYKVLIAQTDALMQECQLQLDNSAPVSNF